MMNAIACFEPSKPDAQDDSGTAGTTGATDGTAASTAGGPGGPGGDTPDPDEGPVSTADTTASDGPDSTDGGTDSVDTGDPPASCPATHTCIDEAPEGWTGPVNVQVVNQGSTPTPCGSGYPELLESHAINPTAPAAVCDCDCDVGNVPSCSTSISSHAACCPFCIFPVDCSCAAATTTALPNQNCVDVPDSTLQGWNIVSTASGGTCLPTSLEQVDDPVFTQEIQVCGTTLSSRGCEGGDLCVPVPGAPYPVTYCIYRAGDHMCPDETYTEHSVHHTSYTDTRDCSPACTCGTPQGTCSGADVYVYATSDCTNPGACAGGPCFYTLVDEACHDPTVAEVRSVRRFSNATFSGECSAPVVGPIGELTPTEPITVCCTP